MTEQYQNSPQAYQEHEGQVWRMRWFFLILITLWTFAAMALPIVAFWLTKNLYSFSLFGTLAPPVYILYRITKHLFPLSENDTKIALAKQQKKCVVTPKT